MIADDHAVVRAGLARLLESEKDFIVCAQAQDGAQALELFIKTAPDAAIVDISMPGLNGLDLIKNIQKRKKGFPILVVSMYDESVYAQRVLRAGARGYLMKKESAEKIVQALRKILSGKIYLSDAMAEKILGQFSSLGGVDKNKSISVHSLSDRELDVFELIGRGHKTAAIAKQLNLSVKTVESYREQIKLKLHLKHSEQLLQHAIEWTHRQS